MAQLHDYVCAFDKKHIAKQYPLHGGFWCNICKCNHSIVRMALATSTTFIRK
ncbi:hypothetical protein DPMN_176617 [Dreissena polymorpha]|uniref:Uncharacterized protein n=1 Tax=Dreissena polymorpha TaxID=45954 RepID=A0A9D4IKS6_DREPO|nr:hypothetical protein DPMN_176617 [Dreissena polymorpha]